MDDELREVRSASTDSQNYTFGPPQAPQPVPAQYAPVAPQPSAAQIMQVQAAYEDARKSKGVMWLLWWFLGGIGGHRYYLRNYGYAVAMTLTLGGLGFWTLIDAFLMGRRLERVNAEIRRDIFGRHGIAAY
ncbi:MAG: TM2 domain-containing protein [Quadrisphaera sp.]